MSKAIAIIPGFRGRLGEYLTGMYDGYYDHVFLMTERSDKPFAFITTQPIPDGAGLTIKKTPYPKDVISNPSMFDAVDVYCSSARGKFGQFAIVKADHLQTLGIDASKLQVFIPEKLGEVYAVGYEDGRLSIAKSTRASEFLKSALGLIEHTSLDLPVLSPNKPEPTL
jgi:hypothetical protein